MVGGTIIGLAIKGDEALVHVRGKGSEKNDTIAVRCKHLGYDIELGDAFWWQCGICYWTPKNARRTKSSVDYDIRLPKVGYSHSHAHV